MPIHSRHNKLFTTKVFKITIDEICVALAERGINIPPRSMHSCRIELDEDTNVVYLCFTDEQDETLSIIVGK